MAGILLIFGLHLLSAVVEDDGVSSGVIARNVLIVLLVCMIIAAVAFCLWYRFKKHRFPVGPCRKLKRNLPNWRDCPVWVCGKGDVEG